MLSSAAWLIFNLLFQSAPDREVGRCTGKVTAINTPASFNPRPTVRSGDARNDIEALIQFMVSIRARP